MPANPTRITITGFSTTGGYGFMVPDYGVSPFNVGIGVTVSSTAPTYSVQHTYDYTGSSTFISSNATWFTNTSFSSIAGVNADGAYTYPVSAIRLNVSGGSTATSTATVTMTVFQAG